MTVTFVAAQPTARLLQPSAIRMSELISALSIALDVTEGQPEGHAIRSCLIGMKIAELIELPPGERSALFYALLLKDLGCSSNAAKMCWLFAADDRQIKRDLKTVDWTKMAECFRFSLSHVAPDANPFQRVMQMVAMAREGQAGAKKLVETRCERGAEIARMLQLPPGAAEAIRNLDEHWNGQGHPSGVRGAEIPLLARILCLAQTLEVFATTHGPAEALEVARSRRGTWFDPQLVDALAALDHDDIFWNRVLTGDPRAELVHFEPQDSIQLADEACLDRVSEAFATVVDAKSPWTYRHSQGVAEIAEGIAQTLGFTPLQQRDIRRAGLLHDIGKLGVSNTILDKPAKPTDEEFAQIRMHPDYSERILSRIESFSRLSEVASAHHERLDGRGYHRRKDGTELALESRILAVADIFEALSAKRPYRGELSREKVLEIMGRDVGTAIDPDCYRALLKWLDGANVPGRVDAQLERLDQLVAEL